MIEPQVVPDSGARAVPEEHFDGIDVDMCGKREQQMFHMIRTISPGIASLGRWLGFTTVLLLLLPRSTLSVQLSSDPSQNEVHWKANAVQDPGTARAAERKRRESEQPDDIVQLIGVRPGMKIGEVGAGTGYFTFYISEKVRERGSVYANDIDKEALVELESRAMGSDGLKNIITVLASEDDPEFPSRNLDMIVSYNSFHDIQNKDIWLRNAVEYLKPEGKLAIIDGYWPEHGGLTLEKLRDYGAQAGLRMILHMDFSFGERSHHVHLFERDR